MISYVIIANMVALKVAVTASSNTPNRGLSSIYVDTRLGRYEYSIISYFIQLCFLNIC